MFDKFQNEVSKFITGSMGRWYATTFFFFILCFSAANLSPLVSVPLIYLFAAFAVLSSLIAFWKTFALTDKSEESVIGPEEDPNEHALLDDVLSLEAPDYDSDWGLNFDNRQRKTRDRGR